ncbi:MAG TPA: MFS transporter [Actinomycetota bacterium]|nr:MFS transporter [Actinomycetota bacterium]
MARIPTQKIRILRPLQIRDFRLLWTAMTVSFFGDGIYLVAIAWQVYELSNVPTALSLVGVAWSLPMVLFLLIGGVLTDRLERRRIMVWADALRGVAVATMGLLAVTGSVRLWHLVGLAILYGIGQALFAPAFGAIVPEIVPRNLLTEANSLDSFVRQSAERLFGPALGGFAIQLVGAGWSLILDAATFMVSAVILLMISTRPAPAEEPQSALSGIKEGLTYVRSQPWLLATLLSALMSLMFALGPFQILLPFLVKNELNGSAADLGLVLAAGGVGAVVASLVMGQRGLPRRHITFMYVMWAAGVGSLVIYGVATRLWHLVVAEFFAWGMFTLGLIVWATLMHRLVPPRLLGRVTSVDWTVSTAFVPLSFALTGPVSTAIGVRETFIWAGILGALATMVFLLWPGVRDPEGVVVRNDEKVPAGG